MTIFNAAEGGSVDLIIQFFNEDQQGFWKNAGELLRIAAEHGQIDVVSLLIQQKVDPNGYRVEGPSPLSLAASAGRRSICKILLDAGARRQNGVDRDNKSASQCAFEKGFYLLSHLIESVDPSSWPPMVRLRNASRFAFAVVSMRCPVLPCTAAFHGE